MLQLQPVRHHDELSKPSQTSVDIASSSRVAASPVGTATGDSSLWRSILDTYGRGILESAGWDFLDQATALRLETITAGELTTYW
jgi:hypothetical protein